MMNEYTTQATDFLEASHTTCTIEFEGCTVNTDWDEKQHHKRNFYNVNLTNDRGAISTRFWDSIANTEKVGISPTSYDVLACLTKHSPDTFKDFCNEFGYSVDSMKAFRVYNACVDKYDKLRSIFTEAQMEELREIN